jgi:hypothetical protein
MLRLGSHSTYPLMPLNSTEEFEWSAIAPGNPKERLPV